MCTSYFVLFPKATALPLWGGVRRKNKINLFFKILLLSMIRAKRIRKRVILTSPHPPLPIRGA